MGDAALVWTMRSRGPLGEFAQGFADVLEGRGYTSGSISQQLYLISELSRWLDSERLGVEGLTELEAERFLAARRARGVGRFARSRRSSRAAVFARTGCRACRCRPDVGDCAGGAD